MLHYLVPEVSNTLPPKWESSVNFWSLDNTGSAVGLSCPGNVIEFLSIDSAKDDAFVGVEPGESSIGSSWTVKGRGFSGCLNLVGEAGVARDEG